MFAKTADKIDINYSTATKLNIYIESKGTYTNFFTCVFVYINNVDKIDGCVFFFGWKNIGRFIVALKMDTVV